MTFIIFPLRDEMGDEWLMNDVLFSASRKMHIVMNCKLHHTFTASQPWWVIAALNAHVKFIFHQQLATCMNDVTYIYAHSHACMHAHMHTHTQSGFCLGQPGW